MRQLSRLRPLSSKVRGLLFSAAVVAFAACAVPASAQGQVCWTKSGEPYSAAQVSCLKDLAGSGNAEAKYRLAWHYFESTRGEAPILDEARRLMLEAADAGNRDAIRTLKFDPVQYGGVAQYPRPVVAPRGTDVASFELGGIRLGMSPQQVVAALKQKYGRKAEGKSYPCGIIYVSSVCVDVNYKNVDVYFGKGAPDEPMRVFMVTFKAEDTSPLDFLAQAIAKYGKPDVTGRDDEIDMWCDTGPACHEGKQLTFERRENRLTLDDVSLNGAVNSYDKKYPATQKQNF